MRYNEFAKVLVESNTQNQAGTNLKDTMIDRDTIVGLLKQGGLHDTKWKSANKLEILVAIEPGSNKTKARTDAMNSALNILKRGAPESKPQHSMATGSSIGGIVFGDGCPVHIEVKDAGLKGAGSSGVGNEENLRAMLQILIMEYGKINVTFVDNRGKKISIKNCDNVHDASKDVADRKKADLVLTSSKGSLPVSLKQVDADSWESGDSLFGPRAGEIVRKLVKQHIVNLIPTKQVQKRGKMVQVYKLDKEIVVEPTEEDAMNAIFGSDIQMSKGGVAVQTFKDEHFTTDGNNVTVQCDYVITKKEDIPESHMMVWLIRNSGDRTSEDSGVGIPGLRVLGSVLTRAIGKKGQKVDDVVLVDVNGNVVKNPNRTPVQPTYSGPVDAPVDDEGEPEVGSEFATREKR
jgi:hypothetical protein